MRNLKAILGIFSLFLIIFFNGCGGGGGGDSINDQSKKYPPATIKGKSERDYIIQNAAVIVKDEVGEVVAETFTDDEGKYEVKVDKFLEPLTITLICNEDSNIVLKDGLVKECEEGYFLRSVIPYTYPDRSFTANITLLTDMTYQIANELGGLSQDNVEDAIGIVSQVFGGVNPVESDPAKGKYYMVLTSLHESGFEDESLQKAFAKALSDGTIDPEDPNEKSLWEKLSKSLKSYYQANLITDAANHKRVIYIGPPIDEKDNEDPDIKAAKDMLTDIRSEVLSIKNYKEPDNPSVYDIELDNFKKIENEHLIPEVSYVGRFFLKVTDMIRESEESGKNEITSSFYRENKSEEFELIVRKEVEEPKNYESWDYVIVSRDRNYTGVFTYVPESEENPSFKRAKTYEFRGVLPAFDKNKLKEGMRDEEYFKGKASRFYRDETSYYLALSAFIKTVNEDGEEITYNVKDSKLAVYSSAEDVTDMKRAEVEFVVADVDLKDYKLKGMFRFSNFQKNDSFEKNGGYLPEISKFSGTFETIKTGSFFKGDLEIRLKNIEDVDFEIKERPFVETKLAGELLIPDHEKILVTLYSDELQRDKFYNELSYTFGTKTIFISGNMERENKVLDWDLLIRNQNSVVMHVIGDEVGKFEGDVKRNGKVVGTFETLNSLPIVRYKDGTFESVP